MAERVRKQRRVGFASPGVAAGRQGAERVAVIALPACDEARTIRLTDLEEVLPRQLERGFDRLRTAGYQIGIGEATRFIADENARQFLRDVGGEEGCVRIGELGSLTRDRFKHARVLVAETGHRGTSGTVEDFASICADEPGAMAADGDWRRFAQAAVENVATPGRRLFAQGHCRHFKSSSATYCPRSESRASVKRRTAAPFGPSSSKTTAASACTIEIAAVKL